MSLELELLVNAVETVKCIKDKQAIADSPIGCIYEDTAYQLQKMIKLCSNEELIKHYLLEELKLEDGTIIGFKVPNTGKEIFMSTTPLRTLQQYGGVEVIEVYLKHTTEITDTEVETSYIFLANCLIDKLLKLMKESFNTYNKNGFQKA